MNKLEMLDFRKKHFLHAAGLYHKEPPLIVKAQGAYVWDSEGKKYLDGVGGIVCISAGHNHPKVKAGMRELMEKDFPQHLSLLYLNEYTFNAAARLLEEAPAGIDRIAFTNSGSEANELAFMAARHATGETVIVNLRHSYHGSTATALSQCGQASWKFRAQPNASTTTALEPYCYRCPFGKTPDSCSLECAKNVETTIQTTTHGKIAAMIVEPVMGVGGFISPPDDYFKEVAKIVHNYGGKYISDEVQTGAGRCGKTLLLSKDLGIDADIVTMAKGLGNGAPIGATMMKTDISEKMAGKTFFNTYAGDPYQTMQAKLVMDVIHEEGLIENAQRMGKLIKDGLTQMMKDHPVIGDVRGRGLLLGAELVKDRKTKAYASDECTRFMDLCKEKGLLLGKGGIMGNVVRIAPPLVISKADADFMLKTMDEVFTEVERSA